MDTRKKDRIDFSDVAERVLNVVAWIFGAVVLALAIQSLAGGR